MGCERRERRITTDAAATAAVGRLQATEAAVGERRWSCREILWKRRQLCGGTTDRKVEGHFRRAEIIRSARDARALRQTTEVGTVGVEHMLLLLLNHGVEALDVVDRVAENVHLGHLLVAGGAGDVLAQLLEALVHGLDAVPLARVALDRLEILLGSDSVAVHRVQHDHFGLGTHVTDGRLYVGSEARGRGWRTKQAASYGSTEGLAA